ncbi:hypothetical protein ACTXT7_012483 [Hymenolepis weldensis]
MANLIRDSALIDSDAVPTRLVYQMSAQFVAQQNASAEQKHYSPSQDNRGWHLPQQSSFKHFRCEQCQKNSGIVPNNMAKTNQGQNQLTFHEKNHHYKPKPKYLRSSGFLAIFRINTKQINGTKNSNVSDKVALKALVHASVTPTTAGKNRSQGKKESLAIIFSVKNFSKFLYGRHFTLLTLNNSSLAETLMGRKPRTIHNALLP